MASRTWSLWRVHIKARKEHSRTKRNIQIPPRSGYTEIPGRALAKYLLTLSLLGNRVSLSTARALLKTFLTTIIFKQFGFPIKVKITFVEMFVANKAFNCSLY